MPEQRTPKRIQLKRTKGWRKPEGAIVVARPSVFGNPFTFSAAAEAGYTRHGAVAAFEDWLAGNPWACPSGDTYEDAFWLGSPSCAAAIWRAGARSTRNATPTCS